MMNVFTIAFTVYHTTNPDEKPQHKKFTFETENDFLAATDEGLGIVFDKYEAGKETAVLFRSITLDNAKEVYEDIKPYHGDKDE